MTALSLWDFELVFTFMEGSEDDFETVVLFLDIALKEYRNHVTITREATTWKAMAAHSNVSTWNITTNRTKR